MKLIQLTKGLFAKVDDEDYEYLNQFKWCAHKPNKGYYAVRRSENKIILMHSLLMNTPKGMRTDHKNGDGLDNQRSNLRVATPSQNGANRNVVIGNSRYLGVHKLKRGDFLAYIKKDYKRFHIGIFDSEDKAAKAYNIKAKELFGEFAALNKIENEDSIILDNKHNRRIRVSQFSLDGKFIRTFNSMTEAAEVSGLCTSKICICCKGKRKKSGGFKWAYENNPATNL